MDFIGIKKNGKPNFDPAVQRQWQEKWDKVKEGQYFKWSLTIPNNGKSQAQLGLIFGNMIANAVEQAKEKHISTERLMVILLNNAKEDLPNGVPVDKDFLHQFMYQISPTFSDDGEPITLRDMAKGQASRLFKVVQTFLASPGIGIIIDDPPEITEESDQI
jgi:hypothetical protein